MAARAVLLEEAVTLILRLRVVRGACFLLLRRSAGPLRRGRLILLHSLRVTLRMP